MCFPCGFWIVIIDIHYLYLKNDSPAFLKKSWVAFRITIEFYFTTLNIYEVSLKNVSLERQFLEVILLMQKLSVRIIDLIALIGIFHILAFIKPTCLITFG